jgi:hypothetical protein
MFYACQEGGGGGDRAEIHPVRIHKFKGLIVRQVVEEGGMLCGERRFICRLDDGDCNLMYRWWW